MKNVRKKRSTSAGGSVGNEKKVKWIKHEVRAKALKDHPDLFASESLDIETNSVRDKVRELEERIVSKPRRDAQRRLEAPDELPMERERGSRNQSESDGWHPDLTLAEKADLRYERTVQVVTTLVGVVASLAFGAWALNFLISRLGT